MKSNMKKILLTIVALLCIIGSEAKNKEVVWEKPTTENGNVYGDGFFNNTKVFDFIEGESDKAFKVSLRYKKLEKLHKSRQNTW